MSESPEPPTTASLVRTEPVQQRSAQRITLLLDAAAALIDETGIDALTTSEVAARSESSVGVVYRYFPNIQSLLRALAARNLERFTTTIYERIGSDSVQWRDSLDVAIDVFIEFNRSERGFRALRFGDIIDDRFLEPEFSNNGVLARALVGLLSEKYDFTPDDDILFDIEVVVEIADALLQRAFLLDRAGDQRFIDRAREIANGYLRDRAELPGHHD
ncbi:TetR/AcrR family transcriptional regulator [Galbitalea soli]|uniref:TetR/AcrR family transcriptional regulator n=1 Tax=Galbitalea soli TaxID=1268042 RepID=A0A7C9TQM3_9MICO|nr:TetR/AcrR family transcriptional regulator [Galbitalea soli]NEM91557.1 TetR/AcrR family transcriptional regulator [Galbitalea soli]NYJ30251.1 AcrR family transcriptional regulator [Galbitalea soli]